MEAMFRGVNAEPNLYVRPVLTMTRRVSFYAVPDIATLPVHELTWVVRSEHALSGGRTVKPVVSAAILVCCSSLAEANARADVSIVAPVS
jgi:hypothetical protein